MPSPKQTVIAALKHPTLERAVSALIHDDGSTDITDGSVWVETDTEGTLPGTEIPFMTRIHEHGAILSVAAQRSFETAPGVFLHVVETFGQRGCQTVVVAEWNRGEAYHFMSRHTVAGDTPVESLVDASANFGRR